MFDSVLVANRGEIAVRVIRTLRRLGIRSVAVFSDADGGSRHVAEADTAVRIGPAPARDSYLHIGRVVEAAVATRAQAVHPGYGFLAENAAFARACAAAALVFVGPPPEAIDTMGDKIRAKQTVAAAGVPVVPGRARPGLTDEDLAEAAAEIGFPVLIKPSAGGGGKGMHLVHGPQEVAAALARARREAASSFGDDTLFLERYVARPRHIEVQVLADRDGRVVHLGERECSLQRRHQKVIEEAPSVLLDSSTRARIGALACDTARAVAYEGAGTVEFIVGADRPEEVFFMEMNTRLQVEHPVTEMVTGIDLVEQQIRLAAGEPLTLTQESIAMRGHAVEARVYAEDPGRGFLPTGGTAVVVREPSGEGVRVDSGVAPGMDVGTHYDPMLAKVVAWGPDRPTALARLEQALAGTAVLGFATNLGFLGRLVSHPDVRAGRIDTGLIDRELMALTASDPPPPVYAAFGLLRLAALWPAGPAVDPWDVPTGWRASGPHPLTLLAAVPGHEPVSVEVTGTPDAAAVRVGSDDPRRARLRPGGVDLDGVTHPLTSALVGRTCWMALDGYPWCVTEVAVPSRRAGRAPTGDDVRSPMPGTVLSVEVSDGSLVESGQTVVVMEAMKMEHALTAPGSGRVELLVRAGEQVMLDQVLARVRPVGEDG